MLVSRSLLVCLPCTCLLRSTLRTCCQRSEALGCLLGASLVGLSALHLFSNCSGLATLSRGSDPCCADSTYTLHRDGVQLSAHTWCYLLFANNTAVARVQSMPIQTHRHCAGCCLVCCLLVGQPVSSASSGVLHLFAFIFLNQVPWLPGRWMSLSFCCCASVAAPAARVSQDRVLWAEA